MSAREIKFRFWHNGDQKMYSWEAVTSISCNGVTLWRDGCLEPEVNCDGHLMQYTGLKDKNGREVYEGDIVATDLSYAPRGQVMYHDERGAWILHDPAHYNETLYMVPPVTVIGNIYENPELLK